MCDEPFFTFGFAFLQALTAWHAHVYRHVDVADVSHAAETVDISTGHASRIENERAELNLRARYGCVERLLEQ